MSEDPPWVRLHDDHLAVWFPYDPDQVADVKAIPGAKWQRAERYWAAPVSQRAEVLAFAARHGFDDVEPAVLTLRVPGLGDERIDIEGTTFVIQVDYELVRAQLLRKFASFDPGLRAWTAPLTAGAEVLRWAERFDIEVTSPARAAWFDVVDARRRCGCSRPARCGRHP